VAQPALSLFLRLPAARFRHHLLAGG